MQNQIIALTLLLGMCLLAPAPQSDTPLIVAGEGVGKVRLGASRTEVKNALGEPTEEGELDTNAYLNYDDKGLSVILHKSNRKVERIYFFNKDRGAEHRSTFPWKTEKGISWDSTEDAVLKAYGKPKEDYSGSGDNGTWRRIVFKGIDFRFINQTLVRISIPGD